MKSRHYMIKTVPIKLLIWNVFWYAIWVCSQNEQFKKSSHENY